MISIVEKDSRALISKNGGGAGARQSLPPRENNRMVQQPMPSGRMSTNTASGDNDVYEEETCCLCITRTKNIKKKDSLLTNEH